MRHRATLLLCVDGCVWRVVCSAGLSVTSPASPCASESPGGRCLIGTCRCFLLEHTSLHNTPSFPLSTAPPSLSHSLFSFLSCVSVHPRLLFVSFNFSLKIGKSLHPPPSLFFIVLPRSWPGSPPLVPSSLSLPSLLLSFSSPAEERLSLLLFAIPPSTLLSKEEKQALSTQAQLSSSMTVTSLCLSSILLSSLSPSLYLSVLLILPVLLSCSLSP